jgi:hypothetical protein
MHNKWMSVVQVAGSWALSATDPGCVKTICVARESRILSNEQMSRHSDFATDGKKQSRFALVRADLEFSHSLDPVAAIRICSAS